MNRESDVKDWILNEVFPDIAKSGKLAKNQKLDENVNESFKVVDINVCPIGIDESFMLTKCYRIKIDYTYGSEEHKCVLIAKKTPNIPPENYDAVGFEALFYNEIMAYTTVIPTLLKFSKVKESDRNFPKYFYGKLNDYEASVVLGDFNSDGWKMSKSRFNLTLEHILLGAQHIGIFHGLCYALKTVNKTQFDSIIGLLKESRFARPPPPQYTLMMDVVLLRFNNVIHKFCQQIPADFLQKLSKLFSDIFDYGKKRVQPIEPYATLCHGDYLRNNMAFAYDDSEDPNLPTNIMMFDFQTLRYSSPMVDLCVFLSLSAGKDVRKVNFDKIFDTYCNTLASTFGKHSDGSLPEFLSKPNLLKEYVRYLPFSLSIATFFLQTLHVPDEMSQEELLADIENIDIDMLKEKTLTSGGDVVDEEIASLVNELYDLIIQNDVDVFKGFL